jgi:predicted nucleic acid-binding protein
VAKKLLDTNILVDALRGHPDCETFLERTAKEELFCSVITSAELWAGVRPAEEDDLDVFLGAFRWVPVDESIARTAGRYMLMFAKSHGLLLPDALIAASAHQARAELVTLNVKHFPMKDIRVVAPY